MNNESYKRLRKSNANYVVVVTYDSCDPVIYGTFTSEKEAVEAEKKIRNGFDDYDWNHYQQSTIERITTVK